MNRPLSRRNHPAIVLLLISFPLFVLSITLFRRVFRWPCSPRNSGSGSAEKYTVVINTWKRPDFLRKSIYHYASCQHVDAIHIVWTESAVVPPSLKEELEEKVNRAGLSSVPLIFDIHSDQTLNSRFRPLEGIRTTAVFSVDDDIIVPCSSMDVAFLTWQESSRTMVGFVPRLHVASSEVPAVQYVYGGWITVWWRNEYSIVLTKASFLSHEYFEMYTNQALPGVRDYVARHRNCEDIAMSILVANSSGLPPVWVKSTLTDIGAVGISSSKGHSERRSECINYFVLMYGYMPLLTTRKIVHSCH